MKIIKVLLPIENRFTQLGAGAIVQLEEASPPVLRLLQDAFHNNPQSLTGDIAWLFLIYNKKHKGNCQD